MSNPVLDQQMCICQPEKYAFDGKPERLVTVRGDTDAFMQCLG